MSNEATQIMMDNVEDWWDKLSEDEKTQIKLDLYASRNKIVIE